MMHQPPGRFSKLLMGYGFQMSKKRNSKNPASKYFQFTRLSAAKIAYTEKSMCACKCGIAIGISGSTSVKCCPATSSITTNCGSFNPEESAARCEAHTPDSL